MQDNIDGGGKLSIGYCAVGAEYHDHSMLDARGKSVVTLQIVSFRTLDASESANVRVQVISLTLIAEPK